MNKFLNDLERKIGKYAIVNLTKYIVMLYAAGYVLQLAPQSVNITGYLTLDPYLILHGQVWRLVSWLLIPPGSFSLLIIITLMFYYFVGTGMERTLGTFRYNVFIFGGMILMIIASFATMFVYQVFFGITGDALAMLMFRSASSFSTYFIQMMVFLAFSLMYPDIQVLLMFLIPIKVRWIAIAYGLLLGYQCIGALIAKDFATFFAIASQFINLLLFYLSTGKLNHIRPGEIKRKREFKSSVKMQPKGITRHKCAVCGRTELDDPNLEFRFCSKCNGNYEYCQDHLFNHVHVK